MNKILQLTVDLIKDINIDICFTLLEVGAVKISEEEESFLN